MAEFKGFLNVTEGGTWRFYTSSSDGSRLFIDGRQVVNNDGRHDNRMVSGKVALKPGYHEFRITYFKDRSTVGAELIAYWSLGESHVEDPTVIPESAFVRTLPAG